MCFPASNYQRNSNIERLKLTTFISTNKKKKNTMDFAKKNTILINLWDLQGAKKKVIIFKYITNHCEANLILIFN